MQTIAQALVDHLDLAHPPIAVSFLNEVPPHVPAIESRALAGCQYWRVAEDRGPFYTTAEDHYGCPIGAHTHGVSLPDEVAHELQGLVGQMIDLAYLSGAEVPDIPRRKAPFEVATYGRLAEMTATPDLVLVRGSARQMMLLGEAIRAAGVRMDDRLYGRPTCAMIPAALERSNAAYSFGCIGNRVYTELGDGESYYALPGPHLAAIAEHLQTIAHANRELEKFHRSR